MAQIFITTTDIFKAYVFNFSCLGMAGIELLGGSNVDGSFSGRYSQMSPHQLALPGVDIICVNLTGLHPHWKFLWGTGHAIITHQRSLGHLVVPNTCLLSGYFTFETILQTSLFSLDMCPQENAISTDPSCPMKAVGVLQRCNGLP